MYLSLTSSFLLLYADMNILTTILHWAKAEDKPAPEIHWVIS